MATKILITNSKYFNQLKNGDDFTESTGDFTDWLLSNIGAKMRFTCEISIQTQMQTSRYDILGGDTINIITGNTFYQEDLYSGGTAIITFSDGISKQFDIASISTDGKTLVAENILSYPALTPDNLPNGSYGKDINNDFIRDISASEGCFVKFNFIGNEDQTNYTSSIDQIEQVFKFDKLISSGGPVTGKWSNLIQGSKTGESIMEYVGTTLDNGVNVDPGGNGVDPAPSIQNYTFQQDFILEPSFLQGEINNIADQIRPDRLNGSDLRHIIEFDFRSVLSNPNNSKIASYDNVIGNMNYYGEVYIDEDPTFTINNFTRVNAATLEAVDGIVTNETTRINFSVLDSSNTFVTNEPVVVGHRAAFTADKYANSKDDFQTTNLYETVRQRIDDAAGAGTIIQNFTVTLINAGQIDVQFDLVYTSQQQARIDEGDNYILFIEVGSDLLTTEFSNKSPLTINTGEYLPNNDVPGLFETTIQFTDHFGTVTDNYRGCVEDLTLVTGQIKTDFTLEANIDSLSIQLIGVNPLDLEDFFIITRLQIPFESFIIEGKQITILESERGFNLPATGGMEIFNKLNFNWVMDDAQFSYYDFEIGYHFSWQNWEALTGVPDAFFDINEPNNGQHKKSSRYSNAQGYELGISLLANMSQRNVPDNVTLYHTISPKIDIFDYDTNVI